MMIIGLVGVLLMPAVSAGNEAGDLNGAAGKLFSVSLKHKSFRFLKQDVPDDPKTGDGKPWHTAYWTDNTVLMQFEQRQNLSGIKGPVIAEFTGFDDANLEALRTGKRFVADKVVLRPDLKDATGISSNDQRVVGWFTPR